MKNISSASQNNLPSSTKKTALDNFQLFYEEIPLHLEKGDNRSESRGKDRLARRSRIR